MRDWKLYALLVTLGPVLWVQGKYVRNVTPRLPEPPGDRDGIVGSGPKLRLLITGDSAAAGVDSSHQEEALTGQLVQHLAKHYTVEWHLIAISGLDSKTMLEMLAGIPDPQFDVVVLSMGVNDVTALTAPSKWIALQEKLLVALRDKFQPQVTFHCAVPPVGVSLHCPNLFAGSWVRGHRQ
jgi:lysophospholipase L1-like esterase